MPPPPQLQPLVDVLPKLDQATLEAALRAAALRLNKRDDEIDADGVMKAFADAGVDGGVKKILSACGYLLKQAGKGGGQSPEKLSSSLGPLGFEERHLRALNETISWVKAHSTHSDDDPRKVSHGTMSGAETGATGTAETDWADKPQVLAAVAENGYALEYAAEELRGDREVVLAAVATDGRALKYAVEELRDDAEVVLAAAAQNAGADVLRGSTCRLNTCKVVVAGDGRVGKTTLLRRLRGEAFREAEASTCGLDSMRLEVRELGASWRPTQPTDLRDRFAGAAVTAQQQQHAQGEQKQQEEQGEQPESVSEWLTMWGLDEATSKLRELMAILGAEFDTEGGWRRLVERQGHGIGHFPSLWSRSHELY